MYVRFPADAARRFQTNNDVAVSFYENYGFVKVGTIEKYYKKIEPTTAHILEKSVNNFDA